MEAYDNLEFNIEQLCKELCETKFKIVDPKISLIYVELAFLTSIINPYLFYILGGCYTVFGSNELKKIIKRIINMLNFPKRIKITNEYQDMQKIYKILLQDLKQLLHKIKIQNPVEIESAYTYLVQQGYLSKNHEFLCKQNEIIYPFNATGIIEGQGVCRHLATFLTDLLNEFEYDSYNLSMAVQSGDTIYRIPSSPIYKRPEKNNSEESESFELSENSDLRETIFYLISEIIKKIIPYNHVVTLYANGDKSYILDPMQRTIYLMADKNIYTYDNLANNLKVNLKKSYEDNFKLPKKLSSKQVDSNKLIEDYNRVQSLCLGYSNTFEQFYLEHKDIYEEILSKRDEINLVLEKYNI